MKVYLVLLFALFGFLNLNAQTTSQSANKYKPNRSSLMRRSIGSDQQLIKEEFAVRHPLNILKKGKNSSLVNDNSYIDVVVKKMPDFDGILIIYDVHTDFLNATFSWAGNSDRVGLMKMKSAYMPAIALNDYYFGYVLTNVSVGDKNVFALDIENENYMGTGISEGMSFEEVRSVLKDLPGKFSGGQKVGRYTKYTFFCLDAFSGYYPPYFYFYFDSRNRLDRWCFLDAWYQNRRN